MNADRNMQSQGTFNKDFYSSVANLTKQDSVTAAPSQSNFSTAAVYASNIPTRIRKKNKAILIGKGGKSRKRENEDLRDKEGSS